MGTHRRLGAVVTIAAAVAAVAACSTGTDADDTVSPNRPTYHGPHVPNVASGRPSASPTGPVATATDDAATRVRAVPQKPLRTVTVTAEKKRRYVIDIWADVKDPSCYQHAYGQPVVTYLITHPCRGLERVLATTTIGGRRVAFARSSLTFVGMSPDVYRTAGAFRTLVSKSGTGNLTDLLREGYRLPDGPASVPSPDAFHALSQDNDVDVYDAWYLDGPTPNNAKALVAMTRDIYLHY